MLVYKYTRDFPKDEQFGLTSQIRRAALSIAANIVEGQASISKKEFLNFLNISNRSLVEAEYLLEVAYKLKYLSKDEYDELDKIRSYVGVLLHGIIRSVKKQTLTL